MSITKCQQSYTSEYKHISASISTADHRSIFASSSCSAMLTRALTMFSFIGTEEQPADALIGRREEPISISQRISKKACSFSAMCLLSRDSDLAERSAYQEDDRVTHVVPNHKPPQVLPIDIVEKIWAVWM
jgi:hypothetical protein